MNVKQYNGNCLRLLLQIALQGNEAAIRQVCNEVGLDYETLDKATYHIAPAVQERLWLRMAQQVDTSNLGMRLGQQLGTTWGGFVNLMAQVSPTLHVVLHGFSQHRELFTDTTYYQTFATVDKGDLTYIDLTFLQAYTSCYPFYCRHTVEGMFVVALQILRTFSKHPITPVNVEWQHPKPYSLDLHQTIFQAPMRFNTGANRLYFRRRDLDRPVVTHNPILYAHFNQVMDAYQINKDQPNWSGQVSAYVRHCLINGQPIVIEKVADELNVSVRSLQRKLEREATIFGQLVENTRRELALQFMGAGKYTIAEVAQLTGYEEASSFRRAFKRWTGSSPKHFQHHTVG